MPDIGWLIVALAVFGFALCAKRLSTSMVTPPMLFLALGWILTETGLLTGAGSEDALHLVAEATLVIVLFSDAAATDLNQVRLRQLWPARMLIIALPVAIVLGTLVAAMLLPGLSIWEAALLAAILAPTDAALSQAVVTNPAVPERVRTALNVESGLNDGLALPAVLFFGCIAVGGIHDNVQSNWFVFAAQQIGLGGLVGAAVGWLGGLAMRAAADRGFSGEMSEGVGVLALAALAYFAAIAAGGNGFLAAFVGGWCFGRVLRGRCRFVFEFLETEGQALIMVTFFLVGAALLPLAARHVTVAGYAVVLISLILVRPAAIWLSLAKTDASPIIKGFLGWFGPRGLATVVFALLVVEEFELLAAGDVILTIAVAAVAVSALLHGLTAAPGARWLGRTATDVHPERTPS